VIEIEAKVRFISLKQQRLLALLDKYLEPHPELETMRPCKNEAPDNLGAIGGQVSR
jgi:hypothetical protein